MERLLKLGEAGELLGLSKKTMAKRIREKKIAFIRFGHHSVRIRQSDLEKYVAEHVTDAATPAPEVPKN